MPATGFSSIPFRSRLGLLALALAGLMFVVALPVRGPFVDPAADAAGWARVAGAGSFALAWVVITLGFVVQVPGILGLYAALEGRGAEAARFWGMLLSVVGTLLSTAALGFLPFGAPAVARLYQGGDTAVIQVATASLAQPPALIFSILSGVLYTVGSVLFAIAIWRSGVLPRWAAIPYALHAPLITFGSQIAYAAEFLGTALLLGSAAWMAWVAWRQPALGPAHEAQPAVS